MNKELLLEDTWVFYSHLPHDTDWSLESYKRIYTFRNLKDMIVLIENIHKNLVKRCMLFIMKNDINPVWEDKSNSNGGCFCFKIPENDIELVWKMFVYKIIGCDIDETIYKHINGISVSPKRKNCIIKVWMNTKEYKNADIFNSLFINSNDNNGLFKPNVKSF